MNPLYPSVASRASFRCEYCRAPEQVFNFAFEVDHVRPRAAEGGNETENLALACESCNLFKSDATMAWDEEEGREVDLFHPRRNNWAEHFSFDVELAELRGRTASGRATVSRLRMNSAFQLRARRHWVILRLYP